MRQNLTLGGELVSLPRRHNSNDEKKDIPDTLDGRPECTWYMIPPANILGFLTGL
jgi:hypothetical protein